MLKSTINEFANSIHQIDEGIDLSQIDFQNSFISSEQGKNGEALAVNLGSKKSNRSYTFMLVKNGSTISSPKLISIEKEKSIIYYNLDLGTNLKLQFEGMKVMSMSQNTKVKRVRTFSEQAEGGCGQATSNCIADAYLNHGWTSVYIFVQTAFLPVTAAAIAAACAAKNC